MTTDTLFTVESLSNGHSQQIIDLILPIQQIEFNVPVTLKDQPDLMDIEGFYIRPGGNFWGALKDEELIGTIALIDTGHAAAAIRKMFVKKEYRGKEFGIAQRLLETLIAYCREKGIKDVYLGTVNVLKAAQRFYERNGFTQIAMHDLPVYFLRMAADEIFYHLSIQS
ncbi:Acetyltransferase (GNAT) domain-containing protein [Chitinophaga sp. YR627]|uniref:GNAT family N-acetyltransferase n=1 Tax=Chitinophaga sp. YR627 TaxID=1881041 RepID=UPI0008E43E3C|nr:GNAT family N-acetyltransferase [Chitinophaga sp. YR627]SFM80161.1 Acetyltransferase (GNAT) domain-containing protein [Chitinophaga sp. YR627]